MEVAGIVVARFWKGAYEGQWGHGGTGGFCYAVSLAATRALEANMSRADRDIDGALGQKFGDEDPRVGNWKPDDSLDALAGCLVVLVGISVISAAWGGMR